MLKSSKIISVAMLILVSILTPQLVFASLCSKEGYTITTVNGIFTDETRAKKNSDALKYYFGKTYNEEPLIIDYLLNKTHSILDVTDVAIQKTFEGVNMWDPDFIKMLSDASAQVKTQKLLIVSHSQGNFYANNVYKVVTDSGDVSKKSIGVYGVASPASYVAGEGRHLTSSTDKVIAFLVENVLPGKIAPVNDTIDYKWSDDSGKGHGFSEIYLEYRPAKIVEDIKWSLDKLSLDPTRSENGPCINPPKELSTIVKIVQPAVYVADTAFVVVASAATTVKNTAVGTAVGTYHLAVNTAVWSYNTTVTVAVWSYNTTTAVAKFVGNATVAVASTVYNAVAGALSNTAVAGNNSAAVILATQGAQASPLASVSNGKASTILAPSFVNNQPVVAVPLQTQPLPQSQPQTVFVFEPKVQGDTSAPKLVFVGSFGGGGGAPTLQVLGTQSTASVVEEVVVAGGGGASDMLTAPTLSAPQCAQTLATDGCLLATTTVHFEWAPVSGASYYATIKNGAYATTTDTTLDVEIKDFSDYIFEVVAVGVDGNASATSTQAVSVASIPIAINEIAWMGTKANTSDEWFEIKNNTGHTIDLTQWELNAKDNTPYLKLAGTIAPHAYLIFERTDDTAVKDVDGEVYGNGGSLWALGNSGEQLSLSYASTTFDQTPDVASSTWAGGSNNSSTTRKTMERYSSRESGSDPENWGTNLGYIKNGTDADGYAIGGTPGAQNSVSTLINKGQDITGDFTLTADEERYVVPSWVLIGASSTLFIEPRVTISFFNDNHENYGYFVVNGQIVANGTPEDPVVFNSFSENRAGGFWIDNNNGTSTFEYAHFEDINSPITVYGGNLEIKNSQFINNDGGVESDGTNTTVLIENTRFASSTSDTIDAYNGRAVRISSSTISNTIDGDAIGAYYSNITIASSTISNTLDGDAIGAYYSNIKIASTTIDGVPDGSGVAMYGGTLFIASSTIKNVSDSGLSLYDATSTISHVTIENGDNNGIEIYGGMTMITDTTVRGFDKNECYSNEEDKSVWCDKGVGIAIYSPLEPVIINGGEVTNNTVGISMDADSAVLSGVSVHDNGMNEEDNVVVW